jgi:hypothetical protein
MIIVPLKIQVLTQISLVTLVDIQPLAPVGKGQSSNSKGEQVVETKGYPFIPGSAMGTKQRALVLVGKGLFEKQKKASKPALPHC